MQHESAFEEREELRSAASDVSSFSVVGESVDNTFTAVVMELEPALFASPDDGEDELKFLEEQYAELKREYAAFASLAKVGSLVDVYTEMGRKLSATQASLILNEGRGSGRSTAHVPYVTYDINPGVDLEADRMSALHNEEKMLSLFKISLQQFNEIVETAELTVLPLLREKNLRPPTHGKPKYTVRHQIYIGLHHFQGLTFRYLAATFNIAPSTVALYFHTTVLSLSALKQKWVVWPSRERREEASRVLYAQIGSERMRKFKVFGFLDGTLTKISQPAQTSTSMQYTNFLTVHKLKGSGFYLGSMAVVLPDGLLCDMSTGYGGSAHDRSIVSNMELFRDGGRDAQGNLYFEEDEFLLGDKGFYTINDHISNPMDLHRVRAEAQLPQHNIVGMLRGDCKVKLTTEMQIDEGLLTVARQTVEQTFGDMGVLFPILRKLRATGHRVESVADIICACSTLYNMWFIHRGSLPHVRAGGGTNVKN